MLKRIKQTHVNWAVFVLVLVAFFNALYYMQKWRVYNAQSKAFLEAHAKETAEKRIKALEERVKKLEEGFTAVKPGVYTGPQRKKEQQML